MSRAIKDRYIEPMAEKHRRPGHSEYSSFTYDDVMYKPLSLTKGEIRLLTFTSMSTDTALHCSFVSMPLSKSPTYTALSYTWGDPNNTVLVNIENFEVLITAHLNTALLRLRAEGVTHVWADALCINQRDNEERTAQVGRMGTIYRKASEVAVWLDHKQMNMEAVSKFSHVNESSNIEQESNPSILPVFKDLLSQPYWKRMWIIQEIAVASHINIYCGDYRIGWDDFVRTYRLGGAENAFITDHSKGETISEFTTLLKLRNDTMARRPISFLDALHQTRSSLSTDPRDKLYALLGISYDAKHFIPEPNYMDSVAECFTDFAIALIESGELLDFIYLRSVGRRNNGEMPSWVPDWTDLDNAFARRQLDHIMNRHSKDSEADHVRKRVTISRTQSELSVDGLFVGTIESLGSAISTNEAANEGDRTADTSISSDTELLSVTSNAGHLIYQIITTLGSLEIDLAKYKNNLLLQDVKRHRGTVADSSFLDEIFGCLSIAAYAPKLGDDLLSTEGGPHNGDNDVEIRELLTTEISQFKQQLVDSLIHDIPRKLLRQFRTWLSENFSILADRRSLESRYEVVTFGTKATEKARGLIYPPRVPWFNVWKHGANQPGSASVIIGQFFEFMKAGMRLLRTEKGLLGWVHPAAQKGDRIARIFGCSQFVVLRAHGDGRHYEVVGDALLSNSVKAGDVGPFSDDEVEVLHII